jgi:hypothetical protein
VRIEDRGSRIEDRGSRDGSRGSRDERRLGRRGERGGKFLGKGPAGSGIRGLESSTKEEPLPRSRRAGLTRCRRELVGDHNWTGAARRFRTSARRESRMKPPSRV